MPGFVAPQILEDIRAASDIVDVIGGYVPLKRAGGGFTALCPFHREKTPSFTVTPAKQIFYCFGCHKGGDVFTFVQAYESLTFVDAVRRLAERAKIPLTFLEGAGDRTGALKEQLFEIHEQLAQRWHALLLKESAAQPARDYLEKRNIPTEASKLFRLGYAPEAWDDTVQWIAKRGIDAGLAVKAGVIVERDGAAGYYDRFRGRLIFPIANEQGRIIGFSGRLLSAEANAAKYINSPETPIFHKGRVFYGLDKSKRALIEAQRAIVCEGQIDLMSVYLAGLKNVVAPQGTAFTDEHARILKRYVEEVVLCFDSDFAGQNAAVRAVDVLLASGLVIRVAAIPKPHDPDSFIKQEGADAFARLIEGAEAFFDFYLKHLLEAHDPKTDQGKRRVVEAMGEKIARAGNEVWLDQYAQKTAMRLEVSPDAVRSEFKKILRRGRPGPGEGASAAADGTATQAPVAKPAPPSPAEFWLLRLLLLHDELVFYAVSNLQPDWLEHRGLAALLARRLQLERAGQWRGLPAFLTDLTEESEVNLASEAASESRAIPNPAQQLRDCLRKVRDRFIEKESVRLIQRASLPGIDPETRLDLLRQRQALIETKARALPPAEISPGHPAV